MEMKRMRKVWLIGIAYDGWIEQANDWSVANLDWFKAYWEVPNSPPKPRFICC